MARIGQPSRGQPPRRLPGQNNIKPGPNLTKKPSTGGKNNAKGLKAKRGIALVQLGSRNIAVGSTDLAATSLGIPGHSHQVIVQKDKAGRDHYYRPSHTHITRVRLEGTASNPGNSYQIKVPKNLSPKEVSEIINKFTNKAKVASFTTSNGATYKFPL